MTAISEGKHAVIVYGDNDTDLFRIGRTSDGFVLVRSKHPLTGISPGAAVEFAAQLITAAGKIRRGNVPLAKGKDGG